MHWSCWITHAISCRGQRHRLSLTASLSATMYKRVICDCIVVPGYCESRKQLCNWNYSCGIRLWPGTWEVDWGCRLTSKSRGSFWFPPWRRLVLVCCCVYCCLQVENSPLTDTFDSLAEGIECRLGFDSLVLASSGHNNWGLTWRQQLPWQQGQWTETERKMNDQNRKYLIDNLRNH